MCVECHTPNDADGSMSTPDSHLIGEKKTALRNCATCHTSGDSLIVVRASAHVDGAGPVTSGYFPPRRVMPGLDGVAATGLAAVAALVALHALGRMVMAHMVRAHMVRAHMVRGRKHHGPLTAEFVYPGFVRVTHWINPLQRVAYLVVFPLGMPVLIASGLLLLLPEPASASIAPRQFLVAAHFVIVIAFGLFCVGHLYLATTGATPLGLVKGMITGFHEHGQDDHRPDGQDGDG